MSMRHARHLLKLTAFGVIYCLAFGAPAGATEIKKLSLDNAEALGTLVSSDQRVKFEGKGSIRVSTKWPTTICLGQISELNLDNAKLIYQAKVKSEDLEGSAYLEMWCQIGADQYFSRGLNATVSGTMNWQTLRTPFILKKGQSAQTVTLNLVINGKGTVWIDDLRLLTAPLE